MKKVGAVFFLAFFLLNVHCTGQVIVLTPETAVEKALESNITVLQNKLSLGLKKREKNFSWNSISPTLSASGSYTKAVPGKNDAKGAISVGASLRTTLTPGLYTTIKNSALAYENQEITYETALRNVQVAVLKSYYTILYEKENLELQKKSLETKKNQYVANLAKYNRGMISKVDVFTARLNYDNSVLSVETMKTNHENSIAQFKQICGIDQSAEVEFTGSFDRILGLEKFSMEGTEKKSLAIESLEKQISMAKNQIMALRFSAWGPSLTAGYSYNYSSNDDGSTWDDGGSLSLSASIPLDGLLPWSKGSQSVESQKDSLKSLELQLENEKTAFEINSDALEKKIQTCMANIRLRKTAVELAETTYSMVLEAYGHGTRDILALQNSEDNLLTARVNLILEANTLVASIYDLENLCGMEFGTLLGERNEN